MRLRHQALSLALAAVCLGLGGCARLLQAILSPQDAAMSTAGNVTNSLTAPVQSQLAGLDREVTRLLNGKVENQAELERIKQELERRLEDPTRGTAAQDDLERLRPWHPRVPLEKTMPGRQKPGDDLRMGKAEVERGIARNGPLPDGIAAAELPTPLDLTRIRLGSPR